MKRVYLMFVFLLLLAGCAKQVSPAPVPEPEAPPVQAEVQIPEPQPEAPPEPEPAPEVPVTEESPKRPVLPEPVYCWNDTAVSGDGTVLLQIPEHRLELCRDAVSGETRGILAVFGAGIGRQYTGLYDLTGQPIITDTVFYDCGAVGNLFWYGSRYDYTLLRLTDGEILAQGLKEVYAYKDRAVLIPTFRYGCVTMLDSKTGEEAANLESGFQISRAIYKNGVIAALAAEGPDSGKQNLITPDGAPMLNAFYNQIYDVQSGCAIVEVFENGGYVRKAVDLQTQQIVFQSVSSFELLPQSALVETENGFRLVDFQGTTLYDTPLKSFTVYEWGNVPTYLIGTALKDGTFCTVVLMPDGTEIAQLPAEQWTNVTLLGPTALAYTVYSGEGALHQKAYFRNLDTGEEILLAEGSDVLVRQIETSGGKMIRCEADGNLLLFLNDGTPARDDLGPAWYLGGDVFHCEEGLRCLDGSWLYRPEG